MLKEFHDRKATLAALADKGRQLLILQQAICRRAGQSKPSGSQGGGIRLLAQYSRGIGDYFSSPFSNRTPDVSPSEEIVLEAVTEDAELTRADDQPAPTPADSGPLESVLDNSKADGLLRTLNSDCLVLQGHMQAKTADGASEPEILGLLERHLLLPVTVDGFSPGRDRRPDRCLHASRPPAGSLSRAQLHDRRRAAGRLC